MTKPLTAKHGTHGGVGIHRRLKEPNCDACQNFKKMYSAKLYESKRAERLAKAKDYYQANKEDVDKRNREWYLANKEKSRFYNRRSYKKNPQKALRKVLKRKALKLGNGFEPYTLEEVLNYYGAICYLCEVAIDLTLPRKIGVDGWEMGLHLDHVKPLSKGGKDCLENVAPTHAICNLNKRGN